LFRLGYTIYESNLITNVYSTNTNVFSVTSLSASSFNIKNIEAIYQPSFIINHTDYNNCNIIDVNLFTSNIDANIINTVKAFTIDNVGRVKIGETIDTNSLFSVQSTSNNYYNTSNLLTLVGYDTSNSIVYINAY
jgi:hypothetical protein